MQNYEYYKKIFSDCSMPFAFVDLDLFDQNTKDILGRAHSGKTIRIASKSIRCEYLMRRILESDSRFQGIMCYSAKEAVYLSQKNFDDLLIAYPVCDLKQMEEVAKELQKGKKIIFMVDCHDHVERLQEIGQKYQVRMPVCLDIDMSSAYKIIHFGVFRSRITDANMALQLAQSIQSQKFVELLGIMGYEAQIAGVGDHSPGNDFLTNMIIRLLKKFSLREVAKRRKQVVEALQKEFSLPLVNGGGTGSVETTCAEDVVTEVTVGSGFLAPLLFDYYKKFQHLPAAGYAIEITRTPAKNIYTCHGGGYVASGASGKDKIPRPYLPEGAKLTTNEAAGEVQTPVLYNKKSLKLGDPIFFRHSKAGELCEHFNHVLLVSQGNIVDTVTTYRGEKQCFLG